nr:unnamed protein product [Callosobruchus chinensis]
MHPDGERSRSSEQKAYVRFVNKTGKRVELVWLDFNGMYVRYQILAHEEYLDVNTYKGHPWIALDFESKDRMHIEKSSIYFPKTTREYFKERLPDKEIPENFETRIRVHITYPLYSLKYTAILAVGKLLKRGSDVDRLELPKELAEAVRRSANHRIARTCRLDPERLVV